MADELFNICSRNIRPCLNEIENFIAQNNVNINFRDNYGYTVLIEASRNGYGDVVEILLKNIADPNLVDHLGWNALIHAIFLCQSKIALLLINKTDLNHFNQTGNTALIYASQNGLYKVVKEMIVKQVTINHVNLNGWSALLWATKNDHSKVALFLIRSGADVNQSNYEGNTPLILASINGNLKIVKQLILSKANLSHANSEGDTALTLALRRGNDAIVEVLSSSSRIDGN